MIVIMWLVSSVEINNMVEWRPKPRFPVRVEASAHSATLTAVTTRGLRSLIDEPEERGGTDAGLTPLETLLASFAGCTTVIANKISQERGWRLERLEVGIVGQLDPRGVRHGIEVTVPFPEIDLHVTGHLSGPNADLDALRLELAVRCPVSVLLRASGSEIRERWDVTVGHAAEG